MKYAVINGPKGVVVEAARGRKEGQELKGNRVVAYTGYDSKERAEQVAQMIRDTQAKMEKK